MSPETDPNFRPLLRGRVHQAMFFMALVALIQLITGSTTWEKLLVSIYGVCALTMFALSTIYHRVPWSPEKKQLWRKLDHAGIYLMIAGTFTPITVLGLGAASTKRVLITIWIVALVGIIQSLFFVNIPRAISASIYLIAGYSILPYYSELKAGIGEANLWLIVAGGVSYSIGAICYATRRPRLNPRVFGFHEVFHVFVGIAAILHFMVVRRLT